ncbi:MAG: C1 family peptidase [Bacteroidales bacterium]|nr:C1 family peptidase [Bacteroidales bacterium]
MRIKNLLSRILLIIIFSGLAVLQAQQTNTGNNPFILKAENPNAISINKIFNESTAITPFSSSTPVYGIALSGDVNLLNNGGLVRIVASDEYGNDYLVFESYPAIATEKSFSVNNISEETSMLNGYKISKIKVELINATINIRNISVSYTPFRMKTEDFFTQQQKLTDAQNDAKIEIINKKGLTWKAGNTGVSHIPYADKKNLVNLENHILNLQGFEYYKEGNFVYDFGYGMAKEIPSSKDVQALPSSWDWRTRHGANNSSSPYYNGSIGWCSSIKNQNPCGTCWAFAPTGALECLVNLYYNDKVNVDLSEQNAVNCSGGASSSNCNDGGSSSTVGTYFVNTGIVNESCLPYAKNVGSCASTCSSPAERFKVASKTSYSSNPSSTVITQMKTSLITKGPMSSGVYGLWHFMCLIGYSSASSNSWIFKNSWGSSWGNSGFCTLTMGSPCGYSSMSTCDYLYGNFSLNVPLTNTANASRTIKCLDADGDGYYNWGIGTKPATCVDCPAQEDANDFGPCEGYFDANYAPVSLSFSITTQPISKSLNVGGSVTFSVAITPATSGVAVNEKYQWKKNNVTIPGATNNSYTISSLVLGDVGSYTCEVKNACTTILSDAATLQVSVNVNEYNIADGIKIYPNPVVANNFTVDISAINYFNPVLINITDMQGRIILEKIVTSIPKIELSTKDFQSGLYFITIKGSDFVKNSKLIIQ